MKTISEIIEALERPQIPNDYGVLLPHDQVAEMVATLKIFGVADSYERDRYGDLTIVSSDGVYVSTGPDGNQSPLADRERFVKIWRDDGYSVQTEYLREGEWENDLCIEFKHDDDDESSGIRIWVKFVHGKLMMSMSDIEGSQELPALSLDDFIALFRFRSTFRNLKKMMMEL